jgi:uncharacterized protein (TIGR03083 family)
VNVITICRAWCAVYRPGVQITPRYDSDPIITMEGELDDQRVPFLRQRRRLETALADLTDAQWRHPSRCAGWTVHDVIAHLISTNHFWTASITAGLAGAPTRLLATFDPVATPALLVEPMRALSPRELLGQLVDSQRAVCEAVESLDETGWGTPAESPAGHLPIRLVVAHGLWDCWVHERDVLIPLGIEPDEEADEVLSCLRYVAALAPSFTLSVGEHRTGALVIDVTDPDERVVVEVDGHVVGVRSGGDAPDGAAHLRGDAVAMVEVLSIRVPFEQQLAPEHRWLVGGLAEVFDTPLAPA